MIVSKALPIRTPELEPGAAVGILIAAAAPDWPRLIGIEARS
jgi:hypothetical protein